MSPIVSVHKSCESTEVGRVPTGEERSVRPRRKRGAGEGWQETPEIPERGLDPLPCPVPNGPTTPLSRVDVGPGAGGDPFRISSSLGSTTGVSQTRVQKVYPSLPLTLNLGPEVTVLDPPLIRPLRGRPLPLRTQGLGGERTGPIDEPLDAEG